VRQEAYDRFDSRESAPDWNREAFDDGFRARMDKQPLSDRPEGDEWFKKSWDAGWCDADMIAGGEGGQQKVP
jgi:hypothetical protein